MLTKLLVFIVVIFLVYIFFFKNKRQEEIKQSKTESKSKIIDGETMVECAKCSTFVSDKESIIKDGQFFCSKECARLQ